MTDPRGNKVTPPQVIPAVSYDVFTETAARYQADHPGVITALSSYTEGDK
ncbi:hypothetical protein OHA38_43360 (plasmid) [Streptomyces sp. NBC_01732]|nr:hypothetical protein OHA38_43360 [Streptomyces sp. NBC_01732]